LRIGEACGLRWRDVALRTIAPRLTVAKVIHRRSLTYGDGVNSH
jgi:integrase